MSLLFRFHFRAALTYLTHENNNDDPLYAPTTLGNIKDQPYIARLRQQRAFKDDSQVLVVDSS
jgi:hypothetical protein